MQGLSMATVHLQVDHLDKDRKAHGEVDVAFWNVLIESIREQRQPDQQQKTQRQNLYGRVSVDEITDESRRDHHNRNSKHDGRYHDPDVVDHSNRRDDGIEREDNVEEKNLKDDTFKGTDPRGRSMSFFTFQLVV